MEPPDPPPAVASLLGAPVTAELLRHNSLNTVTAGIWRVRGPQGSAVLKVVSPRGEGAAHWPASDEPRAWNYWRREALAYVTGFADAVYDGSGLAAPTLLASAEGTDGRIALWLEDVAGLPGPEWTVERVALCAVQLGRAQGACAGRGAADEPWLSQGFLRDYTASRPTVAGDAAWEHPVVRAVWPDALRARLQRWAQERDRLVGLVEALPRTVCHLDVWPANLVARDGESVLVDWAFVGDGAVGEDAGNLVPDCVFDGFFPSDALADLAEAVESAYVSGLREAGWRGASETARLGIRAGGAAKYWWLAPAMLRRVEAGEQSVPAYGGGGRTELADALADRRPALELLAGWAEQALTPP